MKNPKISVIMPVYNGEKYLNEAIDSILHQTYTNFEFIILNDGSTDKTEEIILSYDDPRIVYVKNEENLQIVKTLNKGIDLAKGKYIARMDADDISLPERFEKQINRLENSNIKVLFSKVILINEKQNSCGDWNDDTNCKDIGSIVKILPKRNCLAHPTLMMETALLRQYKYDIHAAHSEDYNLWLRLISDGNMCDKIDEELVHYRIHEQSITVSQNKNNIHRYKKNILAKFYHLVYKAKKLSINEFDKRVMKYMFIDIVTMMKEVVREPLKNVLMKLGRFTWNLYPKYLHTDILFVFNTYDMGGAERVHLEVLKVAKKYNTVTLFTNKSRDKHFFKGYEELTQIEDTSKISNTILGRWLMAGYMQKSIEQSNIKMLFGSRSGLFYDVLSSIHKGNMNIIELFHAMDGNIEFYSIKESEKINVRIFIDNGTRDLFCKLFDRYNLDSMLKKRCSIIENGVSVPDEMKKTKKEDVLKVLFVGRDAPVKRLHIIRNIAQKLEKISFVFVGVSDNVEDGKNIHAVGKVQGPQPYYREADILLLTSKSEGFPMVIMEAMANGVVVISTDVGGISKHIHNADNGFLIESDDEETIEEQVVDMINYLDSNRTVLDTMSKKSYEYAKNHFSIERFYQQYEKLFDESLKGKKDG